LVLLFAFSIALSINFLRQHDAKKSQGNKAENLGMDYSHSWLSSRFW